MACLPVCEPQTPLCPTSREHLQCSTSLCVFKPRTPLCTPHKCISSAAPASVFKPQTPLCPTSQVHFKRSTCLSLEARIPEFGPAGLAMLAYACGQLGGHAGRVMVRLLAASTPQLATFSGPELSALITSCARLGQLPEAATGFRVCKRRPRKSKCTTARLSP
eukprot:1159864-Pelagomonas_calceolata.AAC.1